MKIISQPIKYKIEIMDVRFKSPEAIWIDGKTLREILDKHKDWSDSKGKKGVFANLNGVKLTMADLTGENLFGANLHGANLLMAKLSDANLAWANLSGADLSGAKLIKTNLSDSVLSGADLSDANLTGAILRNANLSGAKLSGAWLNSADLSEADLSKSDLHGANLSDANLSKSNLSKSNLIGSHLTKADMTGADLSEADLSEADLSGANLSEANLSHTDCVKTNFTGATLENAQIYGISVWDVQVEGLKQKNLVITKSGQPVITVDSIEVAQFIYLILNNQKIREVIGTITDKGVLILGRFTPPERKAVLDAMRDKLRENDFVPIVFDFEKATSRDIIETVQILAGLSRFVIADVTSPKSSPLELQATVPDYQIPFVIIIKKGEDPFSMIWDLIGKYDWVLEPIEYKSCEDLLRVFKSAIITPALKKQAELLKKKNKPHKVHSTDEFLKKERPKVKNKPH